MQHREIERNEFVTPLPPRICIGDLEKHFRKKVRVSGFVDALRDQKKMQFLVLGDKMGRIQAVHEKQLDSEDPIADAVSALTIGSAVSIVGEALLAPQVKLGGLELVIERIEIASVAEAPLPIAPDSTIEKQIDHRQISLRTPENQLIFAVQTT